MPHKESSPKYLTLWECTLTFLLGKTRYFLPRDTYPLVEPPGLVVAGGSIFKDYLNDASIGDLQGLPDICAHLLWVEPQSGEIAGMRFP